MFVDVSLRLLIYQPSRSCSAAVLVILKRVVVAFGPMYHYLPSLGSARVLMISK